MRAFPADLVCVGPGRLVAVVAIGDQQLGAGGGLLNGGDRLAVGDPPDAMMCAVVVRHLAPGLLSGERDERVPRGACRVGVEGEDRREVGLRRAREAQPVLLRAGVRALVGPDPPGAVLLHPHPAEEPASLTPVPAARHVVLLRQGPHGGLGILDHGALSLPAGEGAGGRVIGVARGLGQVDLHHVVGGAASQP